MKACICNSRCHNSISVHGPSRESGVICFGCYNDVDEDDPRCCDKCGLPLCNNVECQESEQHQAECKTLCSLLPNGQGRKISMELLNDIALLNEVVLILRCLSLRDVNVSGWLNFTSLQSHLDMREETELGERAENAAKFILERYRRNFFNLILDVSVILLITIL